MSEFKSFKDFYSGPDPKTTELTKEQREAKKKAEKEYLEYLKSVAAQRKQS
jgi:hypothetical protein